MAAGDIKSVSVTAAGNIAVVTIDGWSGSTVTGVFGDIAAGTAKVVFSVRSTSAGDRWPRRVRRGSSGACVRACAQWNREFIDELVSVGPDESAYDHDDQAAGAFNKLEVRPEQKPSLPPRGAPAMGGRFARR